MKLNKKDRYLESIKNGRIFIWTKRLAMRNDMREFDPEFDTAGELVRRKETAERMADLERRNAELEAMLDSQTAPENEETPVILGGLEEDFEPTNSKVSKEFLMTKSTEELRKFAFDVFGEKLNHLKKAETLVNDILDLQKKMEL